MMTPSCLHQDGTRKLPRLYEKYDGTQKVVCVCKNSSCVRLASSSSVSSFKKPGGMKEKKKVVEQFRSIMCSRLGVSKLPKEKARIRNWHFHPSLIDEENSSPYSYITDSDHAKETYEEELDKFKVDDHDNCWFVMPSFLCPEDFEEGTTATISFSANSTTVTEGSNTYNEKNLLVGKELAALIRMMNLSEKHFTAQSNGGKGSIFGNISLQV